MKKKKTQHNYPLSLLLALDHRLSKVKSDVFHFNCTLSYVVK